MKKFRIRRKAVGPLKVPNNGLVGLRASHRLWDDGRYPNMKVIEGCTVEINIDRRRMNIIKGPKVIAVISNIPHKQLDKEMMELEIVTGIRYR